MGDFLFVIVGHVLSANCKHCACVGVGYDLLDIFGVGRVGFWVERDCLSVS